MFGPQLTIEPSSLSDDWTNYRFECQHGIWRVLVHNAAERSSEYWIAHTLAGHRDQAGCACGEWWRSKRREVAPEATQRAQEAR